jgi:hypothetical protein
MVPGRVKRIALQPDGQILVAGCFTEFDGFARAHLVRLNGDGKALRLGPPTLATAGTVRLSVSTGGRSSDRVEIQAATQLSAPDWKPIGGSWDLSIPPVFHAPGEGHAPQRFYRAVAK